jgi:isopentenyl-diphosphate delta-isomerase
VGTSEPFVELVDASGVPLGPMSKSEAHSAPGRLHRAISVFLVDPAGGVLLQQRAAGKYHSPAVWANSCCSHPMPGESPADAASRRVFDELGISLEPGDFVPSGIVTYTATDLGTGLVEHEYDHLFVARFDGPPKPDPSEVAATIVIPIEALLDGARPSPVAAWFETVLDAMASTLVTFRAT